MTWNKRISTLESANAFWNRYGVQVEEHNRSEYKATFLDESITAANLTALWFVLGDKLIGTKALIKSSE